MHNVIFSSSSICNQASHSIQHPEDFSPPQTMINGWSERDRIPWNEYLEFPFGTPLLATAMWYRCLELFHQNWSGHLSSGRQLRQCGNALKCCRSSSSLFSRSSQTPAGSMKSHPLMKNVASLQQNLTFRSQQVFQVHIVSWRPTSCSLCLLLLLNIGFCDSKLTINLMPLCHNVSRMKPRNAVCFFFFQNKTKKTNKTRQAQFRRFLPSCL